MQAVIYRSKDREELDRLARHYKLGMPFVGRNGERIGTILRTWRAGEYLMAEIECVPEDMPKE
jgi:hypothetical protein